MATKKTPKKRFKTTKKHSAKKHVFLHPYIEVNSQSYTKETTKITTIHKTLRCILMIDKYSTFIQ